MERDTTRLGASEILADFVIPADVVRTLKLDAVLRTRGVTVPAEPVQIDFFAEAPCDRTLTAPVLDASAGGLIAGLAKKVTRPVPLFVLDTGWPDPLTADRSRTLISQMVSTVRSALGVPFTAPPPTAFQPPSSSHCQRIARALEEFEQLDPNRAVPVIYVPLSREQGAESLLHELLFTGELLNRSQLPRPNRPRLPIPADVLRDARAFATSRLQTIPPKITGRVTTTEKAIVESLIHVATARSILEGGAFVVSESWVLSQNVLAYAAPLDLTGLVVTAAGNFGVNIVDDRVDFARRALTSAEFVTVLNTTPDGAPVCGSSTVAGQQLQQMAVVGFNGDVVDGSATSFATPRVAWLIALAEASRTTAVNTESWAAEFRRRLLGLRPSATNPWLEPQRILSLWK
jgi:hypothetical protein